MGLVALQSLVDIEVSELLGYLFPPQLAVSDGSVVFPRCRSPVPFRARVHPLLSFTSSSEHCCFSPARYPRAPSASFRVFLPFATPAREVHSIASFPHSPTSRPQRFSRSRRLTPSRALQACFILLPRPGFALQGFSPLPSRLASRRVVPSCRCRDSPTGELPRRGQILPPQLQGFDPGSDPLRPTGGLDLPTTRSPPGLSTPAGFSPGTLATPSRHLRS
jgi:hypothetical protein